MADIDKQIEERLAALERDSHAPQPVASPEQISELWREMRLLWSRISKIEKGANHG